MAIEPSTAFNPYDPPSTEVETLIKPLEPDFRLFLIWEKLRLIYNVILAVETGLLILLLRPTRPIMFILGSLVGFCFLANVCFCLGPVLNAYARWIGLKHRVVTLFIFMAGTLFSVLLAAGAVISLGVKLWPNQD